VSGQTKLSVVLPSQDLQDFQDQDQNPATHATGSWCYVLCAAGGTPCVYTKDARHIFFQHEHKLCFSNIYFQTFKPSKARKGRIKSKFTKNLILFFKQQQQAHTNTHTHTPHTYAGILGEARQLQLQFRFRPVVLHALSYRLYCLSHT